MFSCLAFHILLETQYFKHDLPASMLTVRYKELFSKTVSQEREGQKMRTVT